MLTMTWAVFMAIRSQLCVFLRTPFPATSLTTAKRFIWKGHRSIRWPLRGRIALWLQAVQGHNATATAMICGGDAVTGDNTRNENIKKKKKSKEQATL